ncbi:MAG TPA: hypothetical protein VLA64_13185 [Azonexus sp.]|nr:hypothetical protein [Azonexus sp.]
MTHLQSEEQKKQRRRGILKAVAGSPVLFTLPTGAAVAAVSITCKEKSATLASNSTPPGALAGGTDLWVRYRVENVTIQTTGSGGTTFPNAFNLGGIWYQVNGNTVSKVLGNINTGQGATSFSPKKYYYLLVDHTKYLNSTVTSPQSFVYLGADQSVAAPIAGGSCWNSITPGAQVPTSNILN